MRVDRDEAAKGFFVYESATVAEGICWFAWTIWENLLYSANSAPVERKWIIHAATLWCARSRMGNKLLDELMTITK